MKIIDISWPISEHMTQYKNKAAVHIESTKTFEKDGAREASICLDSHAGTHIESPAHFMRDGITIDKIDLTRCCGHCQVIDMTFAEDSITDEHLSLLPIESDTIILLKTTNSELHDTAPFDPDFVYLAASGAEYLVEKKVKAIGIDYVGLERSQQAHATHQILMQHNIIIIEGLRLDMIHAGNYVLACLPLALVGLEAAPARAVLIQDL
jgi:arylformamidase